MVPCTASRCTPSGAEADTQCERNIEKCLRRRRWGREGPPEDAYSRVTNAERFRPLHPTMLEIIGRLENGFEVERTEGYGLDEELERGFGLARPCVRLSPRDPDAAPIAVVFSAFPGLHVLFGRWHTESFPICGCDACDESAEDQNRTAQRDGRRHHRREVSRDYQTSPDTLYRIWLEGSEVLVA